MAKLTTVLGLKDKVSKGFTKTADKLRRVNDAQNKINETTKKHTRTVAK